MGGESKGVGHKARTTPGRPAKPAAVKPNPRLATPAKAKTGQKDSAAKPAGQGWEMGAGKAKRPDGVAPQAPVAAARRARPASDDLSTGFSIMTSAYDDAIRKYALAAGLAPRLVKAIIWQESRGNPKARSPRGAIGLMQMLPRTATGIVTDNFTKPPPAGNMAARLQQPDFNIQMGTRYIASFDEDYDRLKSDILKLAAYNAGPPTVDKLGRVPRNGQTEHYVKTIMDIYYGRADAK